jgi:small nuclear ribonucleoprotein (snRNP)-like protein
VFEFIPVGRVKRFENKKVRVGKAGSKEKFEGILDYCDSNGNLIILTDEGSVIIQRQQWGYITDDFTQPKEENFNGK